MLKAAVTACNDWKDLIEQIKGENNHMDFEFNVGDYVETSNGAVGFITYVYCTGRFRWMCVKGDNDLLEGSEYISSVVSTTSKNWRRIGKYDFTKKDLNQIEHCISTTSLTMLSKINELVNAVNELREKSINK